MLSSTPTCFVLSYPVYEFVYFKCIVCRFGRTSLTHVPLHLFHSIRSYALKYSADAVCTVLRVDQVGLSMLCHLHIHKIMVVYSQVNAYETQIIMAKPAGGPRPPQQGGMDED